MSNGLGFDDDQTRTTSEKLPSFERSVSQLLFTYLPDRVVDWEDGQAVVKLTNVRLRRVWEDEKANMVLQAVEKYLDRWVLRQGKIHRDFPPIHDRLRFAIGEPESITAEFLDIAFVCTHCSRMLFVKRKDLLGRAASRKLNICPDCHKPTLRQFSQVFVHACGSLVPIGEFLPAMRPTAEGGYEPSFNRIRCPNCGDKGQLRLPARAQRPSEMELFCAVCGFSFKRFTARCPDCVKALARQGELGVADKGAERRGDEVTGAGTAESPESPEASPTAVAQVLMRQTRYSSSDAYHPHSVTVLMTNGRAQYVDNRSASRVLRGLLPNQTSKTPSLSDLIAEFTKAVQAENKDKAEELVKTLQGLPQKAELLEPDTNPPLDGQLRVDIEESIAFGTVVKARPIVEVVEGADEEAPALLDELRRRERSLGLQEVSIVDDLPVLTATFGYSRRYHEPVCQEEVNGRQFPVPITIRPFNSLDRFAAVNKLDRYELLGTRPILARQGKHQGLFFSLNPERVLSWLEKNGIVLGSEGRAPLARIVSALEPVDQYYDEIWTLPVRRLVFGLVHTISHTLMKALSRYVGLERTSISEYVLLPLLGAVVYDSSTAINLGAMETGIRNDALAVFESLEREATKCIYDVDCIDLRQGACHGCIHSPEISCRVFNHGLSRAFLLGGHAPWTPSTSSARVVGYWERSMNDE